MILLDTSGLIAAYDRDDPHYDRAAQILQSPQQRVLSPFVLAEFDYLLERFGGQQVALAMLHEVAVGTYLLATMTAADIAAAAGIIERYADLRIGLTDASIVVLAERYECLDVLTLDPRHFRVMTGPRGKPFRLLPSDA